MSSKQNSLYRLLNSPSERDFSLEKEYREDLKKWLFEIWGKKESFMRKEDFVN